MLTPEQAAEAISKFHIKGWEARRSSALQQLPEPLARAARSLVHPRKTPFYGVHALRQARENEPSLSAHLASLDEGRCRTFFDLMFSKLGPSVAAAWKNMEKGTFTTGYIRRPFRAPHRPSLLREKQDEWLRELGQLLRHLEPDAAWLAAYAPHLNAWNYGQTVGPVLAAAIDLGGDQGAAVLDVLKQSASGTHEIGIMGQHVTRALLGSSSPDAWAFVESLLRAAQRQEGLRQSILEVVDESNPQAFRRFLELILSDNLTRFSATVRAIDVWFGFAYEAMASKHAASIVQRTLSFLDDTRTRRAALVGGDGESAYIALWTEAYHDVDEALPLAQEMLRNPSEEVRYVAAKLLGHIEAPEAAALLSGALDDPDLRVAARAVDSLAPMVFQYTGAPNVEPPAGTFERILRLLNRLAGRKHALKPLVFPWERSTFEPSDVGALIVQCVPAGQAVRVIPVLDQFGARERAAFACLLVGAGNSYDILHRNIKPKHMDATARAAMVQLLGDPAPSVREVAGRVMDKLPLEPDEVARHEALLERAAGDIRTRALARLLTQPDPTLLASVQRLLAGGTSARAGGLELLRAMSAAERSPAHVNAAAQAFSAAAARPSADEARQLELIRDAFAARPGADWTLENALGLLDDSKRAPIAPPERKASYVFDQAAARALLDLDELVEANKTRELRNSRGSSEDAALLGGLHFWNAPRPFEFKSREDRLANCPVIDLVQAWFEKPHRSRSDAPMDLLRARVEWSHARRNIWQAHSSGVTLPGKLGRVRNVGGVDYLMDWLASIHLPDNSVEIILNWTETAVAAAELDPARVAASGSSLDRLGQAARNAWKKLASLGVRTQSFEAGGQALEQWVAQSRTACFSGHFSPRPQDYARLWRLLRWLELYSAAVQEARVKAASLADNASWEQRRKYQSVLDWRPTLRETIAAWGAGAATEHDFFAAALIRAHHNTFSHGFSELESFARYRSSATFAWPEGADGAYDRIRTRVLEFELSRGDAPTPASAVALALRPSGGMNAVVPVLVRFGREKLLRTGLWAKESRAAVYSTLLRNAIPRAEETPEMFANTCRAAGVSEHRLIELALYAPQWAAHVERALEWPSLGEGVWWIHAHTKDSKWRIDSSIRDAWDARIAERTPVPADELADGAVDPDWFSRAHGALGKERWKKLYDAAKFASGAGGHKRAQLFADAILGGITDRDLIDRVQTKRHQDSLRALGLCPVKSGKQGTAQVLDRYRIMQEFRRTSAKHGGSMLQASEKRAVDIGMQNLARTAGYSDPIRLQWAMETEAVADLAQGPVSAAVGDTTISLAIDESGVPALSATKRGKTLKSVPAEARKHEKVRELSARLTELRRQMGRMRQSLELAMCRADEFTGSELAALWRHPLLRPMLARLVFAAGDVLGCPDGDAASLRRHDGSGHALARDSTLRIAHPHDLLASREWHAWQRHCMDAGQPQPFKQVFRELYLSTPAEQGDVLETVRYRSHQVQPRQALALFGSRGWVSRPEEGVHRTFHHERITAFVTFEEGFWTPAEIEGLTLRGVSFVPVGDHKPLRIDQVPPRLFSEVMRDLDLVVSVAHAGAVDPEASASTIQMRATLLRETAHVLKLDNVAVEDNRATIRGHHALYSLHLGSANVQMLPGGSLFVIAVQSQHRGRVFLPFADDDPKTAEVISKALLLARDKEIQDPSILDQIRR